MNKRKNRAYAVTTTEHPHLHIRY